MAGPRLKSNISHEYLLCVERSGCSSCVLYYLILGDISRENKLSRMIFTVIEQLQGDGGDLSPENEVYWDTSELVIVWDGILC